MKHAIMSCALACALGSASAFAPAALGKLGVVPRTHLALTGSNARSNSRAVACTKMDMGVVSTLAGVPLMYGV